MVSGLFYYYFYSQTHQSYLETCLLIERKLLWREEVAFYKEATKQAVSLAFFTALEETTTTSK